MAFAVLSPKKEKADDWCEAAVMPDESADGGESVIRLLLLLR